MISSTIDNNLICDEGDGGDMILEILLNELFLFQFFKF